MYVLIKLARRAETMDTLIYFVSDSHSALEELLLSLFDEVYQFALNYEQNNDKLALERSIKALEDFKIIEVPYVK